MEFYSRAAVGLSASEIQRHVRIGNLPDWCASIEKVLAQGRERGEIYCVWGDFRIHREMIRDGLRFSLPGCPNALQWTVTADGAAGQVVVHCTINRPDHDPDFVDSIERFVLDWKQGLEAAPARIRDAGSPQPGEPMPWFG